MDDGPSGGTTPGADSLYEQSDPAERALRGDPREWASRSLCHPDYVRWVVQQRSRGQGEVRYEDFLGWSHALARGSRAGRRR